MKTFVFCVTAILACLLCASQAISQIDFEGFADGTILTNQYLLTRGVSFPDGVIARRCVADPNPGNDCDGARSGQNVARSQGNPRADLSLLPMVIEFNGAQRFVALYVNGIGPDQMGVAHVATLEAFDAVGNRVASQTRNFTSSTSWPTEMRVTSTSQNIKRVVLTGGTTFFPTGNWLLVDDLTFERNTPPDSDSEPPAVTIVSPADRATLTDRNVNITIRATDNLRLKNVEFRLVYVPTGIIVRDFADGNICGLKSVCPPTIVEGTVPVTLSLGGEYEITARATDAAANSATEARSRFTLDLIDIWAMGMEYNQGFQDFVFTDLSRARGTPGAVTISSGDTRGIPIIPGKPMVVRVYVGLRQHFLAAPPAEGYMATGRLLVNFGAGDMEFTPIENNDCADHLFRSFEAGQACRQIIRVHPSLGNSYVTGRTEFDLDVVAARCHWEGTLNFVIPAETTQLFNSAAGIRLRAIVEPSNRPELNNGDNEFQLQTFNIVPFDPLSLRLVRVFTRDLTEPSIAVTNQALTDALKLMPFTSFNSVSNRIFFYDGSKASFRICVFGICGKKRRLKQSETLWLQLSRTFGLSAKNTLIALTPSTIELEGNNGLGWRVIVPVRGTLGGIAFARVPEYAGDLAGDLANDRRRISTLAQELYHAHLDRRHVSNDHGEGDGCFLSKKPKLAKIIKIFTSIDPDCYKPAPYPHATIGSYLEPPGLGPVNADRGGMGIGIDQKDGIWKLTLYDPCPSGPLDRTRGLTGLQEWVDNRCVVSAFPNHELQPHDFMSYGPNRWTSRAQFFNVPPSGSTLSNALEMSSSNDVIGTQTAAQSLQITGFIVSEDTAGFAPISLAPDETSWNLFANTGNTPIMLSITDNSGNKTEITPALGIMPAHLDDHPVAPVFFTAALPPGLVPKAMSLIIENNEIGPLEASANPPEIRVISPNGGEVVSGAQVQTIRWQATDADADTLDFQIQFSADGGQTWQPLGTVENNLSMAIPARALAETQQGLIRVIASDGMNVSIDQSDSFFSVKEITNSVVIASTACLSTLPESCTVTIPLAIDVRRTTPAALLGSFSGRLNWDTKKLKFIRHSGLTAGFLGFVNTVNAAKGEIIFNGTNVDGAGGEVEFLKADFQVVGAVNDTGSINMAFSAMSAAKTFNNLLPLLTVENCHYTIRPSGVLGDVNGDGLVNTTDASIVLAFNIGFPVEPSDLERIFAEVGDVNRDKITDATDALLILSFARGIATPYPIGKGACP